MFNSIFPIFAFGVVITGIVLLGLQQASDQAKGIAAQIIEEGKSSQSPEAVSPGVNYASVKAPAKVSHV
jgi:hypothetical protein